MVSTYLLAIKNLHLNASIGIFDHEKKDRQPIVINIKATAMPPSDLKADNYNDVPCYKRIVDAITKATHEKHYELVETLCHRFADICFEDNRILSVWIKIEKPEAFEQCQSVGVEMTFAKP